MKRVKYKKELPSLNESLKLVPNELKVNNEVFEMTDGNKSFTVRWEGTLEEGHAVPLSAEDKKLVNEDISKMKNLWGYKSETTIGTPSGENRMTENKMFKDLLSTVKKKSLVSEGIPLTGVGGKEGDAEPRKHIPLTGVGGKEGDAEPLKGKKKFPPKPYIGELTEEDLLDEGIMSNLGKVAVMLGISLSSFMAMAQESPQKAVDTIKQKAETLTPEQLKDIQDATGIQFTADGANQLFSFDDTDYTPNKIPKLNLGKYGDIKAAKVVRTQRSNSGRIEYTVEVNKFYSSDYNFNILRSYIGKQNKGKMQNATIKFVNHKGSPYGGADITFK